MDLTLLEQHRPKTFPISHFYKFKFVLLLTPPKTQNMYLLMY